MSAVEALSCQELVELCTDYLEDALSPEARAQFEAHLEECANCQHYLDQMRATIELTGTLTPESISPEAERTLLDAFRGWKSG